MRANTREFDRAQTNAHVGINKEFSSLLTASALRANTREFDRAQANANVGRIKYEL